MLVLGLPFKHLCQNNEWASPSTRTLIGMGKVRLQQSNPGPVYDIIEYVASKISWVMDCLHLLALAACILDNYVIVNLGKVKCCIRTSAVIEVAKLLLNIESKNDALLGHDDWERLIDHLDRNVGRNFLNLRALDHFIGQTRKQMEEIEKLIAFENFLTLLGPVGDFEKKTKGRASALRVFAAILIVEFCDSAGVSKKDHCSWPMICQVADALHSIILFQSEAPYLDISDSNVFDGKAARRISFTIFKCLGSLPTHGSGVEVGDSTDASAPEFLCGNLNVA